MARSSRGKRLKQIGELAKENAQLRRKAEDLTASLQALRAALSDGTVLPHPPACNDCGNEPGRHGV
ncbi:MAG TPA: hypothetical protein VK281_20735 [Xanthobacteraceae bacterium]|nr:hypothetical protein [Xanthobacteraceae bacterium]